MQFYVPANPLSLSQADAPSGTDAEQVDADVWRAPAEPLTLSDGDASGTIGGGIVTSPVRWRGSSEFQGQAPAHFPMSSSFWVPTSPGTSIRTIAGRRTAMMPSGR